MRRSIPNLCLFFLLCPIVSISQPLDLSDSIQQHANKVFTILMNHSVYRYSLDWESMKPVFYHKVKEVSSIEELGEIYQLLFKMIGDFHGGYYYKGKGYGINGPQKNFSLGLSPGFSRGAQVRTEILEGKYGYVFVPPMMTNGEASRNIQAKALQDSICKLNQEDIEGWIIDLRINLGGDMYAMLGGLNMFFDDGVLGMFKHPDGKHSTWSIKGGNVYEGDTTRTDLEIDCTIDRLLPIAVLTSPITSSSGEIVAISFDVHSKAKLIGECTSGYTTAIEVFRIDKSSLIHLSVARMADKSGQYQECIEPDILVEEGDNMLDFSKDRKIQEAIKWMKKS